MPLTVPEVAALGSLLLAGAGAGAGYIFGWRREGRERRTEDREEDKQKLDQERLLNERFQALWDRIGQLETRNEVLWKENTTLREVLKQRDDQHEAEIQKKDQQVGVALSERDTARRERDEALAQVGPLKEQVDRLQDEVEQLRAQVNGNGKDATHG